MKKFGLVVCSVFIALSTYCQEIKGTWNGVLEIQGMQLRIVFHISKTDKGYQSTMDSPDQGAKDIPVSSTSFEDSILKLEIASAGIHYEGKLNEDNEIKGTFNQAGQAFPVNLTRQEIKKAAMVRPQEPVKPYPYYSEEIKFENKEDKIRLAGTLTLPKQDGIFPAVILISGSGPQNRDEEVMGHKPFLIISDYLTRNGIAVLRFDDRGTAESTGDFKTATSKDFARDVESAATYLQSRKEIDKTHIGLIGHSEGGLIAPMVAAHSQDISFIVLLAGPGIRGNELLLLQQKLIGEASGMSQTEVQKTHDINKGAFDILLKNKYPESEEAELTKYIEQILKEMPDSTKPANMSNEEFVKMQVERLTNPWMNFFIKYNPEPTLEKVKCPILALNGEKDLQVPARVNLQAIEKAVKKGGNSNVTVVELPGLNHLFQECKTGFKPFHRWL